MAIVDTKENTSEFVNAVVALRERNGYDDSDFFATVWNGHTFKEICYATTRFATDHMYASIDATPEIKAKYEMYCKEREALAAYQGSLLPTRGKKVTIVRGRKHKGKVGEITGVYPNQFRRNEMNARVRDESGETFFVPVDYCEVIVTAPAPVLLFE